MSAHRYPTFLFAWQRIPSAAIAVFFLALGAGLRLWQYAAGKSLWIDEIALTRNFARSFSELLFAPLIFGQIAPRGFVLVEKLAVTWLGSSDSALRLFPLVCSLLALILFWQVANLLLDRTGALVALALFASAAPLVIYSGQVKQYSTEVLIALWLFWLVLRALPRETSYGRAASLCAAGWIAVFFSHTAVFVLLGLGGALAARDGLCLTRSQGPIVRPLLIVLISWGIAALAAVLVATASLSPGGQVFLPNFWARGFPPNSFAEWLATLWPWEPMKNLLSGRGLVSLGYRYPIVSALFMALGSVWLGYRDRNKLALLIGPILAILAAAVLRQYPFSDRLILFLLPNVILLVAAGVACLGEALTRLWRPLELFAVVTITGAGIVPILKDPPPYWTEDAKPILAYHQRQRRPSDVVYLYYGASQAAHYYGPQYGLSESDYFAGDCYRGFPRKYFAELDLFRGHDRLWLMIIHAAPEYRERDDIVAYLDAIGWRRAHYAAKSNYFRRQVDPAEIFLFDLSDAERLRRATAETFPITARTSVDPQIPCSIHERPVRPSGIVPHKR